MSVTPLEGPNAGWIFEALETAFQKHGSPKHIISDRASVFIGDVFIDLLDQWDVKPRFGAIRQHGSISVTERVIKTLKYEWLKRVPIIKGFDHLTMLCEEFGGSAGVLLFLDKRMHIYLVLLHAVWRSWLSRYLVVLSAVRPSAL